MVVLQCPTSSQGFPQENHHHWEHSNISNVLQDMPHAPTMSSEYDQKQHYPQQPQFNTSQVSQQPPGPSSSSDGNVGLLKVSLPPECYDQTATGVDVIPRIGIDDSVGDGNFTESSYGSIPHLEASPRRYRTHAEDEFQYDLSASTLGVPMFANKMSLSEKGDSHRGANTSVQNEPPPKLPERIPKTGPNAGVSPPPLPPKKPLGSQNPISLNYSADSKGYSVKEEEPKNRVSPQPITEDDIYDFPPDPTISGDAILSQKDNKTCVSEILKGKMETKMATKAEGCNMFSTNHIQTGRPMISGEFPTVSLEELSKMRSTAGPLRNC